jgi:hypothetical protein
MTSFSVWIACLIASSRLGSWFIFLSFSDGNQLLILLFSVLRHKRLCLPG